MRLMFTLVTAGLILAFLPSTAGAQRPVSLDSARTESGSVPVVVWNREITRFRAPVEGIPPAERARSAERRLLEIPSDLPSYRVEVRPIAIGPDSGVVILVNSTLAFGLSVWDADRSSGETLDQVSQQAVSNVRAWLADRNDQLRWSTVLRGLAWALAATLLAVLLLTGLLWAHRRAVTWLEKSAAASKKPMQVGRADLRPYVHALEAGLLRTATWALGAAITYLWLTFVLSQFAYTRPWGQELGDFIVGVFRDLGLGILNSIPNLFVVFVIFLIARMLGRIATAFFRTAESQWMHVEIARATRRLVVALLWIFAIVVAYPYLPGSGTAAFQGVSVFIGLMVSLGSSGIVSQVLGGLVVVYTRAFTAGDYVRIAENEGTVTEIGALAAKVTTVRKEEITIPYSVLVSSATINYSRQAREGGAIVATDVAVGYDVAWRQVVALLVEAAHRTSPVLTDPAPRVQMRDLGSFAVEYRLLFRIARPAERYIVLSELHSNILDAFNEHGVQIMTPAFEGQPESRLVVPKSAWYAAPAPGDESAAGPGRSS
ncbi:MAG: mechanosensitive ion channel family protein [Candidatus Eiseniibacteriota bacterium]